MKTEIELRQRAIALFLQGWKKSEIARKLQRSRRWVHRWIGRYEPDAPTVSLQNHSRAPKQMDGVYSERIKKMVLQSRVEREKGKRAKYQYALVSAQAIYYEFRELHVSPLPSPRTIHRWLKRAGQIRERKSRKPPNPTYPLLPCQAVNDVQELDFKGPFYLQDHSHKYYLVALRDKMSKKTALRALANKSMDAILDFVVNTWQKMGCPKRLKMDNCLDFRGSNLYPRSPSKLVRVCLDLPTHLHSAPGALAQRGGGELEWFARSFSVSNANLRNGEAAPQSGATPGNYHKHHAPSACLAGKNTPGVCSSCQAALSTDPL